MNKIKATVLTQEHKDKLTEIMKSSYTGIKIFISNSGYVFYNDGSGNKKIHWFELCIHLFNNDKSNDMYMNDFMYHLYCHGNPIDYLYRIHE